MNPEAKIMLDYCASKGITRGRMLDLGAGNDAEGDSSVAKPFIDAGWEVVLVDASPSCVAIQAAKYGMHPKVSVVSALVGTAAVGIRPFFEIPGDLALSTGHCGLMTRGIGRETFRTIYMESTDCLALVERLGPFDVVSVDLEGASLDVAYRLMNVKHAGLTICVEVFPAEVLGVDEAEVLSALARSFGYTVDARTKENVILVRA